MKIIVASKNPVKIRAALKGFEKMFPKEKFAIEGISVPSGVPDQPTSDRESLNGALNRAKNASKAYLNADFWVGMEAATTESDGEMRSYSWVVVKSKNKIGKGRTTTYILPEKIASLIKQGMELGDADDLVFKKKNSKQENGSVGILTHNVIDRVEMYWPAVAMALIPFKNPELYI